MDINSFRKKYATSGSTISKNSQTGGDPIYSFRSKYYGGDYAEQQKKKKLLQEAQAKEAQIQQAKLGGEIDAQNNIAEMTPQGGQLMDRQEPMTAKPEAIKAKPEDMIAQDKKTGLRGFLADIDARTTNAMYGTLRGIGGGIAGLGRDIQRENDLIPADSLGGKARKWVGEGVEDFGSGMSNMMETERKRLVNEEDINKEFDAPLIDPETKKFRWDLIKNPAFLASKSAEGIYSTIPIIATGIATGGSGLVASGFLAEKGNAYEDYAGVIANKKGVDIKDLSSDDIDTADKYSNLYGAISGVLEAIPLGRLLNKAGSPAKQTLKNAIFSLGKDVVEQMLTEGTTESLQQFAQNVIAKYSNIDPERKLGTGVLESGVTGSLSGGVMGVAPSVVNINTIPNVPNEQVMGGSKQEEKKVETPKFNEKANVQNFIKSLAKNDTTAIEENGAKLSKDELTEVKTLIEEATINAPEDQLAQIQNHLNIMEKIIANKDGAIRNTAGEILAKKTTDGLENGADLKPAEVKEVNKLLEKVKEATGEELPKIERRTLPSYDETKLYDTPSNRFKGLNNDQLEEKWADLSGELMAQQDQLETEKKQLLSEKKQAEGKDAKKAIQERIDSIDAKKREIEKDSTKLENEFIFSDSKNTQDLIDKIFEKNNEFDFENSQNEEWGYKEYKAYLTHLEKTAPKSKKTKEKTDFVKKHQGRDTADLRNFEDLFEANLDKVEGEERQELVDELNVVKDMLNEKREADQEVVYENNFNSIKIHKLSDGTYEISVNGYLSESGVGIPFSGKYKSREEAINAGKNKLLKWINSEINNGKKADQIIAKKITAELEKVGEKTQKEKVVEAVKKSPKTIKQISEETKILEPNVRRILGVGAKEGTFERVDKGVYILSKDGQDIAYVETASAVESLPKLAKDGFRADMIFLDIPYDTPAVKGGNRGVKYGLLSVENFGKILDAVDVIKKTENTPIVYMYSQAESGLKAMAKYNDLVVEKGFIPVGKGEYQKTFADGSPVTSPNGKVAKPEGIIVFSKSGKLNKNLKNLNYTLKRPKGYQTEKPAEMLRSLIEMTTEEGEMVLDPFAGSGVTLSEAVKSGRKAYGIEINEKAVEEHIKPKLKNALEEVKNPHSIVEREKRYQEWKKNNTVDQKNSEKKVLTVEEIKKSFKKVFQFDSNKIVVKSGDDIYFGNPYLMFKRKFNDNIEKFEDIKRNNTGEKRVIETLDKYLAEDGATIRLNTAEFKKQLKAVTSVYTGIKSRKLVTLFIKDKTLYLFGKTDAGKVTSELGFINAPDSQTIMNLELLEQGMISAGKEIDLRIAGNKRSPVVIDDSAIIMPIVDDAQEFSEEEIINYLPSAVANEPTSVILKELQGRESVSKEFITNLTNKGGIKQVERDIIREVLADEESKVNVPNFVEKVKAQFLPLEVYSSDGGEARYEQITLQENRGSVANYVEKVYQSPIETEAGKIHWGFGVFDGEDFGEEVKGYFGHTRIEDMAVGARINDYDLDGNPNYYVLSQAKVKTETRRVIEVQSDLYQRDRLEQEMSRFEPETIDYTNGERKVTPDRRVDLREEKAKLLQYNNPTAHFRMVREEIKQASQEGIKRLQFPTGKTAMDIEGLSRINNGWRKTVNYKGETQLGSLLKDKDLEVGLEISKNGIYDNWIIIDILNDSKFVAIQKGVIDTLKTSSNIKNLDNIDALNYLKIHKESEIQNNTETFDISGKLNTNDPVYKFYEKDLGRYLKNNYNATLVEDKEGVSWYEVLIKPEYDQPVEAFMPSLLDGYEQSGGNSESIAKGVWELKKELKNELKRGTIDLKQYQITDRFVDKFSDKLEDISLVIDPSGKAQGLYAYTQKLIKIFRANAQKKSGFTRTFIHEVWHSLSSYLPENDYNSVKELFEKQRDAFYADPKNIDFRHATGKYRMELFSESLGNYRYYDMDEWFAENMTDMSLMELQKDFQISSTHPVMRIFAHLKSILKSAVEAVQSIVGGKQARDIFQDFWQGKNNKFNFPKGLERNDQSKIPTSVWDDQREIIKVTLDKILNRTDKFTNPDNTIGFDDYAELQLLKERIEKNQDTKADLVEIINLADRYKEPVYLLDEVAIARMERTGVFKQVAYMPDGTKSLEELYQERFIDRYSQKPFVANFEMTEGADKDFGFANYEERIGKLGGGEHLYPLDLPDLVKLARELTGQFPEIKKAFHGGKRLGDAETGTLRVRLLAGLFAEGKIKAGKAVLAHELGHIMDFLPEGYNRGGNVLGRIASIMKNLKHTLADGSEFNNKTIRAELIELTKFWRQTENPSKYMMKPVELYADALSVLLNSPALLQEKAPQFTEAFFEYLDNKPQVKESFFEMQELLGGSREEVVRRRQADLRKGFAKAKARRDQIMENKKNADRRWWERLRQQLDDQNYPILKKQSEREALGEIYQDEENPRFLLEELPFMDNENYLLLDNLNNDFIKPLELNGVTVEDIGEYLTLKRIITGRKDVANPYGFTPESSVESMEFLRKDLGESRFNMLEEKVKLFHDTIFKSVETAVEVGSYNKQVFEDVILPNKDTYVAFQVVDYMDENVHAGIKKQIGTFKEIGNPMIATLLKTISLNRLNSYQRAKNATLKMLGSEATESKTITSDGKLKIFKVAENKGALEVLVDGKLKSYDVDPYIAESFEKVSLSDINRIVGAINIFNNEFFKPVVTTYNMGFALAFNPIRDFKRNYKAIKNATLFGLLKAYAKSLPEAYRYAKGNEMGDFTKMLMESKAISAPIFDYNFDPREDEFGKVLEKYGLITTEEKFSKLPLPKIVRKTIIKGLIKTLESMRLASNTLEIVSKISGATKRIEQGESGRKLSYNVRNFTGTPNWTRKGKQTQTTNALFVFSNIMKEGLKSDYLLATQPNTRKGYWWKTVKVDLLPKILMYGAQAGLLGFLLGKGKDDDDDWLKKFYAGVSEYDKTNYIIVPLGINSDGKSVYMRIPHDESGRMISAVAWKLFNTIGTGISEKKFEVDALQQVFAIGAGQLPNLSPAVSIPIAWGQYLAGKNPYDWFRGRNIIDDTTFSAGGTPAFGKMVKWTANSFGITSFATYDTSQQSGVETFFQITPLFNRLIKISDYGKTEKELQITSEEAKQSARDLLEKRDIIKSGVKAGKDNEEIISELGTKLKVSEDDEDYTRKYNAWDKIIEQEKEVEKSGVKTQALLKAYTNASKIRILQRYQKEMGEESFQNYMDDLLYSEVISQQVYNDLWDGNSGE